MKRDQRDLDNEAFARESQLWLADEELYTGAIDGWAGTRTVAAFRAATQRDAPSLPAVKGHAWPAPDERSLVAFYGPPGPDRLVTFTSPFPLVLAWETSTTVTRVRCHELVAESLESVLVALLTHFTLDGLRAAQLDHYGGCYSFRRQRGGRAWSLHAWGAAIDLDPARNGFHTAWPARATMPVDAIRIFEQAGWTSGARAWGRDAMHFQATS